MTRKEWTKPARQAFEAKVSLLENWAREERVPDDLPRLKTIDEIRLWTDTTRDLKSWTSFSVAAPGGDNPDLRARLDVVLPLISRIRDGVRGKNLKPRRGKPISQIQHERENAILAKQNQELITEVDSLTDELTRIKQLNEIKDNAYQELLEKYNKLLPFGKN
jgi:hypothetical protein